MKELKLNFLIRIKFIIGVFHGLTLEKIAASTALSRTTCFYMRHKLYEAISANIKSKLNGTIYLDPIYTDLSFKGVAKAKMPRPSKRRGKHKPSRSHKDLRGINHNKLCIMTVIDDNDNILFKVAGLGVERREIIDQSKDHMTSGSLVVIDKKRALETFVTECGCTPDIVSNGLQDCSRYIACYS